MLDDSVLLLTFTGGDMDRRGHGWTFFLNVHVKSLASQIIKDVVYRCFCIIQWMKQCIIFISTKSLVFINTHFQFCFVLK